MRTHKNKTVVHSIEILNLFIEYSELFFLEMIELSVFLRNLSIECSCHLRRCNFWINVHKEGTLVLYAII